MDDYRWMDTARRLLNKGEDVVEMIKPQRLTHVSSVRVCAPKGRDCTIYGEVSFHVDGSSTTLFSREKYQSDDIELTDDECYLSFLDIHETPRALPPVSPNNPLHVKMDLTEARSSGEDVKIAEIDCDCDCDCDCDDEMGKCFVVEGLNGFEFEVCYSVVSGVWVEVGAELWRVGRANEEQDCVMDCEMQAYLGHKSQLPQTCTLLRCLYDAGRVAVAGSKEIALDRRFVVAPIGEDQFLCVRLSTSLIDEEESTIHDVSFCPNVFWDEETKSVWASKDMTHSRNVWLADNIKAAVSIRFHPEEEAQTRDIESSVERILKLDTKRCPYSLEEALQLGA